MAEQQQPIVLNADFTTIDPAGGGGGQLPVGRHKVVIDFAKQEAVKDKPQSGKLKLTLKCIEGAANGQTGTDNLNLWNENPEAARIAWQELSAYGHVMGVYRVGDIRDMFGKPFWVDVALQKGDNPKGYTEIVAKYDLAGNPPGKQGQGGAAPAATAPSFAQPAAPAAQPQPQQPAAGGAWTAPAGGAAPAGFGMPPGQPAGAPAGFGAAAPAFGAPAAAPAAQPAAGPGAWAPGAGGAAPATPWGPPAA